MIASKFSRIFYGQQFYLMIMDACEISFSFSIIFKVRLLLIESAALFFLFVDSEIQNGLNNFSFFIRNHFFSNQQQKIISCQISFECIYIKSMIQISKIHYQEIKDLLDQMNKALIYVMNDQVSFEWKQQIHSLKKIIGKLEAQYEDINKEFDDGKITKKTLTLQLEALEQNNQNLKQQVLHSDQTINKCRGELTKVLQENSRLKDYIRRQKQQAKKLKGKVSNLTAKLENSSLLIQQLQTKIKYLEKNEPDKVGHQLDEQLQQLAKLEQQMGLSDDQV